MLSTKALTSKARQHNKNQNNDKGTDINTGDNKDTGEQPIIVCIERNGFAMLKLIVTIKLTIDATCKNH